MFRPELHVEGLLMWACVCVRNTEQGEIVHEDLPNMEEHEDIANMEEPQPLISSFLFLSTVPL